MWIMQLLNLAVFENTSTTAEAKGAVIRRRSSDKEGKIAGARGQTQPLLHITHHEAGHKSTEKLAKLLRVLLMPLICGLAMNIAVREWCWSWMMRQLGA